MREDGYTFSHYRPDGRENWYSPASWRRRLMDTVMRNAKRRAAEAGVPYNITTDYLVDIYPIDGVCPVLGTPMVFGGNDDHSPSLDRIDPDKGYVAGNVAFISMRANRLKQDATLEELERVANYIRKTLN